MPDMHVDLYVKISDTCYGCFIKSDNYPHIFCTYNIAAFKLHEFICRFT